MVKPNINLVEVHPQLRYNWHPVGGALVGDGLFTLFNEETLGPE
jgi:hypothetical protein